VLEWKARALDFTLDPGDYRAGACTCGCIALRFRVIEASKNALKMTTLIPV
jgi:hypothetical protein